MSSNSDRRLKIVAGADVFGCALKDTLVSHLKSLNIEVEDLGTDNHYTIGAKIGHIVSSATTTSDLETRGLVVCGTGAGVSIFANKFPGVYATICLTPSDAVNARSINNCNVIAFSGHSSSPETAIETLNNFLNTPFKSPCPASNNEPWPDNIQSFLDKSISEMSKIGTSSVTSVTGSCSICDVASRREFTPVEIMPGASMKIVRESPTSAVVRFSAGSIEPAHHHKHGHDVVVMKGKKIVWNLSRNERFELSVGDYLFTSAGDVHRVKYLEDTEFFIRWDGDWDIQLDEDLATAAANLEKQEDEVQAYIPQALQQQQFQQQQQQQPFRQHHHQQQHQHQQEEEQEEEQQQPVMKKRRLWTPPEEEALAEGWCKVSEDGDVGDFQKANTFWGRVKAYFLTKFPDSTRSADALGVKYREMITKINAYQGIYIQMNHRWSSGSSDDEIIQKTSTEWKMLNNGRAFPHMEAWKVVKDHLKWKGIELMGQDLGDFTQKRTKTSESRNYTTSSNDPLDLNEDTTPTKLSRRSKGKKPDVSSSMSDMLSSYRSMKEEEKKTKQLMIQTKIQRDEMSMQMMAREEKKSDLKFFSEPHDHLSEPNKTIMLDMKRDIAKRWGWPCDF